MGSLETDSDMVICLSRLIEGCCQLLHLGWSRKSRTSRGTSWIALQLPHRPQPILWGLWKLGWPLRYVLYWSREPGCVLWSWLWAAPVGSITLCEIAPFGWGQCPRKDSSVSHQNFSAAGGVSASILKEGIWVRPHGTCHRRAPVHSCHLLQQLGQDKRNLETIKFLCSPWFKYNSVKIWAGDIFIHSFNICICWVSTIVPGIILGAENTAGNKNPFLTDFIFLVADSWPA